MERCRNVTVKILMSMSNAEQETPTKIACKIVPENQTEL